MIAYYKIKNIASFAILLCKSNGRLVLRFQRLLFEIKIKKINSHDYMIIIIKFNNILLSIVGLTIVKRIFCVHNFRKNVGSDH